MSFIPASSLRRSVASPPRHADLPNRAVTDDECHHIHDSSLIVHTLLRMKRVFDVCLVQIHVDSNVEHLVVDFPSIFFAPNAHYMRTYRVLSIPTFKYVFNEVSLALFHRKSSFTASTGRFTSSISSLFAHRFRCVFLHSEMSQLHAAPNNRFCRWSLKDCGVGVNLCGATTACAIV